MVTPQETPIRCDQWLWAVRIFKTRSLAADKCRRGHVKHNGLNVKASRKMVAGMQLQVKKNGCWYDYKVLDVLDRRVSATVAAQYVEDVTPQETLERYQAIRAIPVPRRDRGSGRPTKKERRELDRFFSKPNEAE